MYHICVPLLQTGYNCSIIVLHIVSYVFRHMETPIFGQYFNHTDEANVSHTKASYRLANLLVSRDTSPYSNSIIPRWEHGDLESHPSHALFIWHIQGNTPSVCRFVNTACSAWSPPHFFHNTLTPGPPHIRIAG